MQITVEELKRIIVAKVRAEKQKQQKNKSYLQKSDNGNRQNCFYDYSRVEKMLDQSAKLSGIFDRDLERAIPGDIVQDCVSLGIADLFGGKIEYRLNRGLNKDEAKKVTKLISRVYIQYFPNAKDIKEGATSFTIPMYIGVEKIDIRPPRWMGPISDLINPINKELYPNRKDRWFR